MCTLEPWPLYSAVGHCFFLQQSLSLEESDLALMGPERSVQSLMGSEGMELDSKRLFPRRHLTTTTENWDVSTSRCWRLLGASSSLLEFRAEVEHSVIGRRPKTDALAL